MHWVTAKLMPMPFIDHPKGRAYYRHWAAQEPRAVVVFLHGFGEHTGVYHRYGFALNAAGIDLWAVDQFGHGLSPGTRGDFGSIADSSDLADTLTELAEGERPGLPLIAQGHSFGAVVTLTRLLDQPDRYRAGVISGAPLVPIPELLDPDSAFDLDPLWLSEDPFYLDSLENDPLAFVDADGAPLARALDTAWDRFGRDLPGLTVPTLAVHGVADPIAPIGAVARLRRADGTAAAQGVCRRAPRHPQRHDAPRSGRRDHRIHREKWAHTAGRGLEPGVVGGGGEECLEVVAPVRGRVLVGFDPGVLAAVEQQRPRLLVRHVGQRVHSTEHDEVVAAVMHRMHCAVDVRERALDHRRAQISMGPSRSRRTCRAPWIRTAPRRPSDSRAAR